jgi:hypothetical protein
MILQNRLSYRILVDDSSGATLVEFAIIAPIFLGIIMFIFDTGYMMYAQNLLSGEVNAVGRRSALETATNQTRQAMDERLAERVRNLVPHGEFEFERESFSNYENAQSRVEPFIDGNRSNTCDNGESYLDLNFNRRHDLDGSRAGGGGARDVVIYTVTLRYDRFFPVSGFFDFDQTVELQTRTLLKNQPFDRQVEPQTEVCA